jgi:hypothetical protein
VSGISLATTGLKTVSSVALPRYGGAASYDVGVWLEVTTALTGTAPAVDLRYTNEAGTASRAGTSVTLPALAVLNTLQGMPLQAGDLGVQAVASLNVSAAGTAGVVNVILGKPICMLPLIANQWNERDLVLQLSALPRMFDGASLAVAILATGTTAVTVWGQLRLAWG